jgi:hypothetical protein
MPAPPHRQACGPAKGWSRWISHTSLRRRKRGSASRGHGCGSSYGDHHHQGREYRRRKIEFHHCAYRYRGRRNRNAVNTKQHGFTVEDKLRCFDPTRIFSNERVFLGPVVAIAGEQADPVIIARDDETEAVLFDFVDPVGVRRNLSPARRD